MDDFDNSAKGFLSRARLRLSEPGRESLLYAALELRYCVEARQDFYIQAQQRYIDSIPKADKIGHQAAALRKLFDSDKILRITMEFDGFDRIVLHYMPVNPELLSLAHRLGNVLHVTMMPAKSDDAGWAKIKDDLLIMYRSAWLVCRGELLSPVLIDRKGEAYGAIEFAGPRNDPLFDLMQKPGLKFKMIVAHPIAAPENWEPDL